MRRANGRGINLVTEKAFQAQVMQLAKICGWWCYHTFDSRRSQPGFPDLVLIRAPKIVFAELKSEKGKVSQDQELVLAQLELSGMDVRIWRPSDWPEVERTLARF